MVGEIISECRATSNRNGGRHHRGFAGDFPRNPHSYATRLFENKVAPRVVQAFLGHENIATTTIYTHLTEPTRVSLRKLLDKVMSGF